MLNEERRSLFIQWAKLNNVKSYNPMTVQRQSSVFLKEGNHYYFG